MTAPVRRAVTAIVPRAERRDQVGMRMTGSSREVRLHLGGDLASPVEARELLLQLRHVQRRLPAAAEVVHLDLADVDHITIEVAVLLCRQRRLLATRGIALGSVTRGARSTDGVEMVLDALVRPVTDR